MVSDKASYEEIFLEKANLGAAKELEPLLGPQKYELAVGTLENKVAFGLLFDDEDMNKSVHGVPIQPGCARVSVDGPIQGQAKIPIPVVGEIETKSKRKGKQPVTELQKVQSLFEKIEINKNVPKRFRLLYKYATTFMKSTGNSIQIPCDAEVFGVVKTIFILHENIAHLLEFKMIGQGAICTYMAYLHSVVIGNNNHELFAFFDPGATFTVNDDFENNLVNRLKEGNPGRLFLMPHNSGCHWILVVIWAGEIFILNPLPRATTFPELEKNVSKAVIAFNIQVGRGNKAPSIIYIPGCPKQSGGTKCGYVVMYYMKEIVMDPEMSFMKKWAAKNRKVICSRDELSEVRFQTLDYIESFL
ncbi:uncharacterized protein LOC141673543 [Apium graveolens]|uniref:uncharacterized protein LOC141673543 n=1 Tax=Apium graveolens TaxID=4045 RepID=UPI003D7BCB14